MQAASDEARVKIDPDNNLLWRRPRVRLEAEAIRDCILAAGGMLDEHMFGPGTLDDNQLRRSIYFTVKRSKLVPMMMLFDAPDGLQAIGRTLRAPPIAAGSFLLLNNRQVREAARHFAARISTPADSAAATTGGGVLDRRCARGYVHCVVATAHRC